MRFSGFVFASLMALSASSAFADDCSTDCGDAAEFRYPCGIGRWCTGRNPTRYATCETAKAASCQIWDGAVGYVVPRIRPMLEGSFNASRWQAAVQEGSPDAYMTQCMAAGIAACGALGAELGGPWGGVISGALGVFVSARACEQSKSW